MALSGTHISCGYSNPRNTNTGRNAIHLLGRNIWSQTMASAGTTTNAAPAVHDADGEPIYSIISSVDIFYAVAPTPDATSGARRYLKANEHSDVVAQPGDKVAWVTA